MAKSSLGRNILTMGTGIIAGRGLGFLQGIVLARMLGASDLGKFATLISLCTIVSRLMDFGLPHAFSYYFRKFRNSLGPLLNVLLLNVLISSVLALIPVFGMRYLPIPVIQELNAHASWKILIYAYLVVGTAVTILPNFLMAGGLYSRFVSFFNLGIAIQIALQSAMYLIQGPSIKSFFIANLCGMAIMTAILSIYLVRCAAARLPAVQVSAKEVYGFGLRSHWGVVMKLSSGHLELPLVSSMVPTGSVGHYSLGNTFREAAMMPQSLYSGIFQNALVDKAGGKTSPNTDPLLMGIIFQSGLSLAIALLGWAVLPSLIPILYGPGFAPAGGIAVLLVFSTVFTGPTGICWIGFSSKGKPQLTSLVATISGLLSPVMILIMASTYGVTGAGWASISVAFITFTVSIIITIRMNGYRFRDFQKAFRDSLGIIPKVLSRK
jgi:O-antigen/teichoic acid export membrane protein